MIYLLNLLGAKMETNILLNLLTPATAPNPNLFKLRLTTKHSLNPTNLLLPVHRLRCPQISATDGPPEANNFDSTLSPTVNPPPDTVEIKFRRGSRRRRSKQMQPEDDASIGPPKKPDKVKAPPKTWDEMSFGEKAMDLYVGEKGLLFWLNKFAYASIFVMIGAWIVFRFVGPALNLYQLDAPPLSPEAVLKG